MELTTVSEIPNVPYPTVNFTVAHAPIHGIPKASDVVTFDCYCDNVKKRKRIDGDIVTDKELADILATNDKVSYGV